jgi:hypothetical protein
MPVMLRFEVGCYPKAIECEAAMKMLLMIALVLPQALFAQADRTHDELDIREATFRYQFVRNASGQKQNAGMYCLSIVANGKETDPDDAFIKRFDGNTPVVKRASDCSRSAAEGVKDRATGKRGLIFRTEAIKWISDTEAQVEGGYYEGGLSASGNTYYLRKTDGKWIVEKDIMHWIA